MGSLIYSILLLSIFILFSKSESVDNNDQSSKNNGSLTWKIIIISLFIIIFFALTVIIIGISLLCKWYCKWPKFTRSSNEESINACKNSPPNSSSQNEPTRLDILESNVQFLTKYVEKRQRQNSLLSKNSTIDELADETNLIHPHFLQRSDQKFNPHTNFFDAYGSFKRSKEKVEMPRLSISENNEDLAFRTLFCHNFAKIIASSSSKSMFEYPINLEWTIAEDRLKALKDSINNKFLESEKFIAFHSSDVQYSLIIYPNGYNEKRGKTWIFFNLELGNAKKIEADFTLSIKSAEWRHKYTFEKSVACGNSCCTVAELFDSRKKFIVDGKFTLKVEGILKIEISESKNGMNIFQSKKKTIKNFGDLWDAGFEDFTFVAEGKEIEVHKNVLACQSPVFATMFKSSKMKEAIESKVEIPDFPYEIVLKALKFCYEQINIANLTMSDSFLLLKFADKYDISVLHEYLEKYLSDNITVENVCEIANAADIGNAQNLRNKCIHFVTVCVALKTFVPNVELLDNNFMVTVFGNNFCRKTQTL